MKAFCFSLFYIIFFSTQLDYVFHLVGDCYIFATFCESFFKSSFAFLVMICWWILRLFDIRKNTKNMIKKLFQSFYTIIALIFGWFANSKDNEFMNHKNLKITSKNCFFCFIALKALYLYSYMTLYIYCITLHIYFNVHMIYIYIYIYIYI